jgi:hypothetical protein
MRTLASRVALVFLAVITASLVATPPDAEARPRPTQMERFSANKTFGAGIMLGAPTGLTGKYFLSGDRAIDFGIGAIGYYRGRDGLHLHADYLWHPLTLAKAEPFWLPLYFGIGGRFFSFDGDLDNDDPGDNDGFALGVRAPVGVAMDFNNVPLEVFFELALVVDFLFDYYDDGIDVDLNGAIGLRYWFE